MPHGPYSADHDACGVGFVTRLGAPPSHEVVERALVALRRLEHRGGMDADGRSGDGAGLLLSIPEKFFRAVAGEQGITLPEHFGVGMLFVLDAADGWQTLFEKLAGANGLRCLGWRAVPTDPSIVGPRARDTLPQMRQCFLAPAGESTELETLLFRFRKQLESRFSGSLYICSLSARTVVYKGLLTPDQLRAFYPDLSDPRFETSFAIFHQRYSTNTQPSWALAQPFRHVAHNGEINTISGNRRWLYARGAEMKEVLGLEAATHLLEPRVSDSASLDNAIEILLRHGYSPAEAMLALVPPAWETNPRITPDLRRFLEAHTFGSEPWDGPAALVFSDGVYVGAKLDRNGLRPLRYTRSTQGWLIVGSEAGIADFRGKDVIERQRLGPGEMLLVDSRSGELVRPHEVGHLPEFHVYRRGESAALVVPTEKIPERSTADPMRAMAALGWTDDQYKLLFRPLVLEGQEAVWSMGDDATPAFLSQLRRPLWDYCKQRFAQVTNPPIDPLRETHVMSLRVPVSEKLTLSSPVVDAGQLHELRDAFQVHEHSLNFVAERGIAGAQALLSELRGISKALAGSVEPLVLLSDRGSARENATFPALLAVAAVCKSLTESGLWRVPIIVETGQVLDTHHIAMLVAAGASGVYPYLALEQACSIRPDGVARFRFAIEKGLRKVIARMGVSTIASYRNSYLFEVLGLDQELCSEYFEGAGCVPGGKTLDSLLGDYLANHAAAYAPDQALLTDAGLYRFRKNGEQHSNAPEVVRRMHRFIQTPTGENFKAFDELAGERKEHGFRDLVEIEKRPALDVSDVEAEASLLSRFSTQAMSLGAISPETHTTLAVAMNRVGGRSNTGEGGEDPSIYSQQPEANNRVKQVASGRFGVTTEYLVRADELEIKIAQGAKPGEGGQLPSSKVTAYIARLRHAVPGTMLISPPPHHDIYSIEDLAQLIYDLRAVNPRARIGVKLVSSSGVGIIATGVAKAGADIITIAGHDGGTGASPITSIKNTGLPWEVGLRDAHCALVRTGLRGRVRLRVDGGLKFARDVVVAALLGAEEFGFGTSALLAIGCVMARQCHLNTCPVGIATQDDKMRARFTGRPEMVESYFRALAAEVRALLASIGATSIDEILGDVSRLQPKTPEAAAALGSLLAPAPDTSQLACPRDRDRGLWVRLNQVINDLDTLETRSHRFRITNSDLAIGAHLSGEIARRRQGADPSGVVACEFTGTAGQSFGSFLVSGVKMRLRGQANDYVGKGLSGGGIAITAGEEASQRGDVLVGNTALYGATSGELFIAGRAGERFAVRNSGALAVVEGVGLHGCEYMTAGVVLVLGPAGMNFGAGMTGGLAYVLRDSLVGHDYNSHSVQAVPLEVREELWLRMVLRRHLHLTSSPRAWELLRSDRPLPLLRVEPLHPPCTPAETWASILARLRGSDLNFDTVAAADAKEPLLM
jgi:glutamate synthase domain-containing protein 2/glutamate synthase domain-containing protein 1/glutamate synthase domain-containing protein 3